MSCTRLDELGNKEKDFIMSHLEGYKEKKHISDDTKAKESFIEKYGEPMKRFYCGLCFDKDNCDVYDIIIRSNSIPK